jgi:hypothetical protein
MAKVPVFCILHLMGLRYRNLPTILAASSILYALLQAENISAALGTTEAYVLISCFGMSCFVLETYGFILAFVASFTGLALTAIINSVIELFVLHFDIIAKEIINSLTVLVGFLFATQIFFRHNARKHYWLWCVITHFILLGVLQRDQLGSNFFPYVPENPIQWVVILSFVLLSGVRRISLWLLIPRRF